MAGQLQYPTPGCVVEFFDGGSAQIGLVTEESGGRLRLMLPNRRETKLPAARVLPWIGPLLPGFASMSKEDMVRCLSTCQARREQAAAAIDVMELWALAQGEVTMAPPRWFAELSESAPDVDTIAAYAHALLSCRTHFRYSPPNFEVFPGEVVERREAEYRRQQERERILAEGAPFMRTLWNVACGRCALPAPGAPGYPGPEVADKVETLLRAHMADPESQEEDTLWKMLIKGLPEVPHLPVQLLMAWGKVPPHYNFWFDRAGYEPGDDWWREDEAEVEAFLAASAAVELPGCDLPFISIDGESTVDVDDAFHIEERVDGGVTLTLALACPALCWPFGSAFDKAVLRRGTSIYLPEGDSHMLPEFIGTGRLSLHAGTPRPALLVAQDVAADGACVGECRISVARVTLAANLRYPACQAVLDGRAPEDSPARPWASVLRLAHRFAASRVAWRVGQGAAMLEREEPEIVLEGEGADTTVLMRPGERARDAQTLVAEMMILASAAVADWAAAHDVPMIHRSQDTVLPREYAGVWTRPEDIARVMRAMIPSILDVQARPHAALGLQRYAPVTSPLRRYVDLVNEAQLMAVCREGRPRFDVQALQALLTHLHVALDAAGQVQRFRPRYWKLLYFRQQGDRVWWPGVVTEENDLFVNVSLPAQDIFVRGRRRAFDERTCPGMPVAVRLGKVNPLYNELQVVEAMPADGLPEENL